MSFAALAGVNGLAKSDVITPTNGVLCLTFDDSHFVAWEATLPIFARYNAHATFFAYHEIDEKAVVSLRRLSKAGHSIGLHGYKHLRAPETIAELGEAGYVATEIEPQLSVCRAAGLPVRSFAYPYNARTEETDAMLVRHGFSRLRAGSVSFSPFHAAELKSRRHFDGLGIGPIYNRDGNEVAAMLESVAANNEVAVFFSHGIFDKSIHNHMSRTDLETILSAAQKLGIAVLGFDELDSACSSASSEIQDAH